MFLYSHWLALDLPTRIKLADIFGIPKKGSTHVQDNQVKSDGYEIADVEAALTVEALQKYLDGTDEADMNKLWEKLKIKIYGLDNKIVEQPTPQISNLSKEEAKQFKKEHKERMKKVKLPAKSKSVVRRETVQKNANKPSKSKKK